MMETKNLVGYKFFRYKENDTEEPEEKEEQLESTETSVVESEKSETSEEPEKEEVVPEEEKTQEKDTIVEMIRVSRQYANGMIRILREDGSEDKTTKEDLAEEGWIPLLPHGVVTTSVVELKGNRDVIVSMATMNDLSITGVPRVVCRQSVTDFFYSMLSTTEEHDYVGVSTSVETCPANVPFEQLMMCDSILFSEMVNIYLDDNLDDIIPLITCSKYDEVLSKLYDRHVKSAGKPFLSLKSTDKGWCKTLPELLKINNFWIDVDQAFHISTVDFDLDEHIVEKGAVDGITQQGLDEDTIAFFSSTYRINITDTIIIDYGYDINLADYNNINYLLIKSSVTKKTYFMRYLVDGEYIETDLKAQAELDHIAATMGLTVYNKYVVKKS